MRNTLVPIASFGSACPDPIMAGLFMRWFELIQLGIIFFTAVVLFQLTTGGV